MSMRTRIVLAFAATIVVLGGLKLALYRSPASVEATTPPDTIRLRGAIRDFNATHADFDISDSGAFGHCANNIDASLGTDGRPIHSGSGLKVTSQWYDKDTNPIKPYVFYSDPGLPGGHFDVDVFDEASTKELYHKHEFDDAYDVTYVDIVNDPKLLFDEVIGPGYPNNLRVEFLNPHHGSGTYVFEAGGPPQTGVTQSGFEATFNPNTLTQFKIDFAALGELRGTKPGDVQSDPIDRDDSLSIQMFDVVTGLLVYELSVYHHISGSSDDYVFTPPSPVSIDGDDACGEAIDDTVGSFGDSCAGAINSAATFAQWYRDTPGTNLGGAHTITLTRNGDGVYEYLTSDFFPVDGRLLGNAGSDHNEFFTYAIAATFTYTTCGAQFFEFEGNDDCWVYINGNQVLDIGGVATPSKQYIALDRLGLVDGQAYSLDFYYAHRRSTIDSIFRMRTNILLETPFPVPGGTYD